MSRVSYFQRFSQRENHVTNNTLLLIRHFYQSSPNRIEHLLSDLVGGEDLEVGLTFEQQIKLPDSSSVLDARISQKPLEIYFETKRGGNLDHDQISRHIDSISKKERSHAKKILIGLTKTPIDEGTEKKLMEMAKKKGVIFVSTTFGKIVSKLGKLCLEHETSLREILEDYKEFLEDEGLLDIGEIMFVLPCGTSYNENVALRLYFCPPDRRAHEHARFIGLYKDWCIGHVAEVRTIVKGLLIDGEFQVTEFEKGDILTECEVNRIQGACDECIYYSDLGLSEMRYYLFDEIHETQIWNIGAAGIMNAREFNLTERWPETEGIFSAAELAEQLRGQTFS